MNNNRKVARMFGFFFILTFLSYGIGTGLIESVISAPDFLTNAYTHKMQIVIGVVLMAFVHTFSNIALPILMLPILKRDSQYLAYGYLSFAIVATVILVVGSLFLLLFLPLSEAYAETEFIMNSNFETMGTLLMTAGTYSYHIGMALWSIGGLMFVFALDKSKLIPRGMSVWGIIGYVTLLIGSIFEIYDHRDIVEIISVIPGGLFEITLSIWWIVKGFNEIKLKRLPLEENTILSTSSN